VSATAPASAPYLAAFRPSSAGPPWLAALRESAIARFGALGFPASTDEGWRFTSAAPLAQTPFTPPRATGLAPGAVAPLVLARDEGPRVLWVDGAVSVSARNLPAGVRVESLRGAIARTPELVRAHLATTTGSESAFTALNTAFFEDGAFVFVPAGVALERPVELLFAATAPAGEATLSHPRTLVVLERGARATVVENYGALADGVYWRNAVTELVVGDGAALALYRVQRESRAAYQVATTAARQGRDSTLRLHPLALGAALARHDIHTELAGRGGELVLNGFYLLGGTQHADHHTVIDHAEPDCASHEYFNGLVGAQAHGVFNGRIIVRPGAQRTDSKQTNHNLLLSTDARADSQPQLEIYADDVKCTHGSTVGPLDEGALFYLESRGLARAAAAAMLTYGFAAEILGRMEHPALRAACEALVQGRLQVAGRG